MAKWKVSKKPVSKARCAYCGQIVSKAGARRHLQACKAREAVRAALQKDPQSKSAQFFHLSVEGYPLSEYWMQIEIPADHTLIDLDQFLRDIWLECCGHLSQFIISDVFYVGQPDEELFFEEDEDPNAETVDPLNDDLPPDAPEEMRQMLESFRNFVNTIPEGMRETLLQGMAEEERSMNVVLKDVLRPGMKFAHEYDFGSTTELRLTAVALYDGKLAHNDEEPIHIMMRNQAPEIICQTCGKKPATLVCTECMWSDEGFTCNDCAPQHDLDMLLPVVNSPRVGVCGYTGDAPEGWAFWVDDPQYYQDFDDEEWDGEWDEDDMDEDGELPK